MLYARSPFKTFFKIFSNGLYGYPQDLADVGPTFYFLIDNEGDYLITNQGEYLFVNVPPPPPSLFLVDNDGNFIVDNDGNQLVVRP